MYQDTPNTAHSNQLESGTSNSATNSGENADDNLDLPDVLPFRLTYHAWIFAAIAVAVTGLGMGIILHMNFNPSFAYGVELAVVVLMLVIAFLTKRFTQHYHLARQQAYDAKQQVRESKPSSICSAPLTAQKNCPYSPHSSNYVKTQRAIASVSSRPFARSAVDDPVTQRCKQLARLHDLSERETEVLILLARGFGTQEIERALVVSANTIKTHQRNIYRKLEVHSRDELNRLFAKQRALIQDYEIMQKQILREVNVRPEDNSQS